MSAFSKAAATAFADASNFHLGTHATDLFSSNWRKKTRPELSTRAPNWTWRLALSQKLTRGFECSKRLRTHKALVRNKTCAHQLLWHHVAIFHWVGSPKNPPTSLKNTPLSPILPKFFMTCGGLLWDANPNGKLTASLKSQKLQSFLFTGTVSQALPACCSRIFSHELRSPPGKSRAARTRLPNDMQTMKM